MMVKLLLYAYCTGTPSSRKIEQKTYEDIAFRFLAASYHPDHDTIAAFRKTHLTAIKGLFLEILILCREAGLVKAGHVSLDGTKIKANASKHKAMSYARMDEKEKQLKQEIDELLKKAERTDAEEDRRYGNGSSKSRSDKIGISVRIHRNIHPYSSLRLIINTTTGILCISEVPLWVLFFTWNWYLKTSQLLLRDHMVNYVKEPREMKKPPGFCQNLEAIKVFAYCFCLLLHIVLLHIVRPFRP
jgi:hypothetical protein